MSVSRSSQTQTQPHVRRERKPTSQLERLLHWAGTDPDLVEVVLGDLTEELAARTAVDGVRAARWWYVREALRSSPHLTVCAFRRASWRARLGVIAGATAVALVATLTVVEWLGRPGAPALLVVSGDREGEGIVVNNERPVRLTMQVLDSSGRNVPDPGVHFRWLSGVAVPVTAKGVATCTQSGDAVVHASLGRLSSQLLLRCRPVSDVRSVRMLNIVAGAPAVDLPILALDATARPVTLLRGQLTVADSAIATTEVGTDGTHRARGRAAGNTTLKVLIGDRNVFMAVHVYARASTPEGIRPGEHLAIPVELAGGDVQRWHLPAAPELYYIAMLPDADEQRAPRLAIVGANCTPAFDAHSFFCVVQHDASVSVFHSRYGDENQIARGTLAVWRQSDTGHWLSGDGGPRSTPPTRSP